MQKLDKCDTNCSVGRKFASLQFRIFLRDRTFVDVYYNQENGKSAFAQVNNNTRIFGADNTNGFWHWHRRENPDKHVPAESEISFEEFMAKLETDTK